MTWLRLDDDWYQRPAIVALSADAFRLHVAGMSHTMRHLTDRVVAPQVVSMLAPGYRVRVLEELVAARLWLPFPDGTTGWWIADPVMDEQPTAAEVAAERAATTARQDVSRARKAGDAVGLRRATERADATREAIAAAREVKRQAGGRPPWVVTPSVTRDNHRDNTRDETRESQRPDPARPGATTSLSGSVGVTPDPSPDAIAADQARLADPTTAPWDRKAAELRLAAVGADR